MGHCQIQLETIETTMQVDINKAKEKAEEEGQPWKEKMKIWEKEIAAFSEEHKEEIEGKTKELNFGKVGFRLRSSISIPTKKAASVLEKLKKCGYFFAFSENRFSF